MIDYIKRDDAYKIALHCEGHEARIKMMEIPAENVIPVDFILRAQTEMTQKAKVGGQIGHDYGIAAATLAWVVALYRIANATENKETESNEYETDIRADGSVLIRPKM